MQHDKPATGGGVGAHGSGARPRPSSMAGMLPPNVLQSGRFMEWIDRTFLHRIRARVDQEPLLRVEQLVQARILLVLGLFLEVGLSLAFIVVGWSQHTLWPVNAELYVLWIVMFAAIIYSMNVAESARLHSLVVALLLNVWPWLMIKEGGGFRTACLSQTVFTPVTTIFMVGTNAGVLSCIGSIGICIVKLTLEKNGYVFRVDHAEDVHDYILLFSATFNVCALLLFGYAYEVIRSIRLQALEYMNESLEKMVVEAQEASEMKTRFLANMSHEIRTPLSGVIGMTEILLQSQLSVTQRKELNIVKQCGVSLLAIISDILDFSKIVANKIELESIPFFMDELVARCFDTISLRAYEKRIQLVHNLAGLGWTKYAGDPTRVQQVLLNLLSNAVKFTPEQGEISLRAWSIEISRGRHRLTCEVSDSGSGVPPDRAALIFEPFSQADLSTTRVHGGTGLGLAITKSLITLMGGTISVSQRPGGGAVFTCDMLLNVAHSPSGSPTARNAPPIPSDYGYLSRASATAPPGPQLEAQHVVIWDDCESHEIALTEMLTSQRHRVTRWNEGIVAGGVVPGSVTVINVATYQPDADPEKEHYVIKEIRALLDAPADYKTRPRRFVLLHNPLGARAALVDAFLNDPVVNLRVRVVHLDRATHNDSPARSEVTSSSSSTSVRPQGASASPYPAKLQINDGSSPPSLATASVLLSPDASTAASSPASEPLPIVAEIVFLTKPALQRHVHWAVAAPLDLLSGLEPGITVLDGTGASVPAGGVGPTRDLSGSFNSGLLPEGESSLSSILILGTGPAKSTTAGAGAKDTPPNAAAGPRVLLVDDNRVNVAVGTKLLALLGFRVEVAEDGVEAVLAAERMLETARTEGRRERLIILMDLHMPNKSGAQAAEEIRRLPAAMVPPYIVAVTADAIESTRAACLSTSFDDFLSKPFNLSRLKEVMQRAREMSLRIL